MKTFEQELESILNSAFEDVRFSGEEKAQLKASLSEYNTKVDKLNFARNMAFEIVQKHIDNKGEDLMKASIWLERVVKTIDVIRNSQGVNTPQEAYFSPGESCKRRIISLIKEAQKNVDVCVFTISDNDISDAIFDAHKRGLKVRVVTDNDKANDRGSDVDRLASQGVNVVKDISQSHMHNKFAIVDGRKLINGSFNWTRSATKYNDENIVISGDSSLISAFQKKFDSLWKDFS